MTTSSADIRATEAERLTDAAELAPAGGRGRQHGLRSSIIHTHLFAPQFGEMNLFGIDELLTYHYLVAETFRSTDITSERFWRMNRTEQADLVWQTLFVENTPLSEATRGVVTVLDAFGLDPAAPDLARSARLLPHARYRGAPRPRPQDWRA